jgi:hypothetical protein
LHKGQNDSGLLGYMTGKMSQGKKYLPLIKIIMQGAIKIYKKIESFLF